VAFFTLRIRRSRAAENRSPPFFDFTVPLQEKMTVLDALAWVQTHKAHDLAFRYACRVGMCGTCTVVINGREGWACRTLVEDLNTNVITVEPLRHLAVVKDLVVDMRPFLAKFESVLGHFVPGEEGRSQDFTRVAPQSKERLMIDPNIQCISCGACYSSCTMVYWDKDYLGPAALNRAATLVMDSRDKAGEKRLEVIDGEHGCWRCHSQLSCTEICPMELRPSESIAYLKRRLALRSIKNLFTPKRTVSSSETGAHAQVTQTEQAARSELPQSETAKRRLRWRQAVSETVSLLDLFSRPIVSSLIVSAAVALIYLTSLWAASKSGTQDFLFPAGEVYPSMLVGALIFEENGCESCHSILGTGGRKGPDLWRAGGKRDKGWLRQVIENPDAVISNSGMPAYDLAEHDMVALVDYVHSLDFSRYQVMRIPRAVARGGGDLYKSGCLECHQIGDLAKTTEPELLRSRLLDPRLHAQRQRESFAKLSEQRIKDIATYLSHQQKSQPPGL
jgi:fumarate reductase iron-sulfur subunit